jgi:hypothetical protein
MHAGAAPIRRLTSSGLSIGLRTGFTAGFTAGLTAGLSTQPLRPVLQPLPPLRRKSGNRGQIDKIVYARTVRHLDLPKVLNGKPLSLPLDEHYLIALVHFPWFQHPVIPTRNPRLGDKHRQPFRAEAVIDLPARAARLRYLQDRRAEPEYISDVDAPLGHVAGGNILAEATRDKRVRALRKCLRQPPVVLGGVLMHGLFRPTVHPQVSMLVSRDTQLPHPRNAGNAAFVDTRELTFRLQVFQTACEEVLNV